MMRRGSKGRRRCIKLLLHRLEICKAEIDSSIRCESEKVLFEMISPAVDHRQFKEKGRAFSNDLPGKKFGLEHQPQADARAERLLEEIAIHAGGCERQFEVLIVHAESLVGVLVNQSLALPIEDVKGIETELQADPLIEFPRILEVGINAGCCGCTAEVTAAVQRDFSGILIGLLSNQGSQGQARLNSEASTQNQPLQPAMIQDKDWVNI